MNPVRILIVDDHPMMRDGIRLLLDQQPSMIVVGACGDRATAWQAVRSLKPDLVVMDIDLPDGSGLDLTWRIRAKFPDTKVLVLTAHLDGGFANDAVAAGAHGFLVKTHASAELVAAIQTLRVREPGGVGPARDSRGFGGGLRSGGTAQGFSL